MMRKKKTLPNDIHIQCRDELESLIHEGQIDALLEKVITLPPEVLVVMLFAPNELKSTLLTLALEKNLGAFFEKINK
jgi:hypothetical protein